VTGTRTPGRPRSETSRQAILIAALELVAETGYAGLTIERIAARAGVGKQTIYRWWPSKADVLLEAGAAKAELHVPVTDHGSYRADLRAFLEASYRLANHQQLADLLRALMAEAQINPEFGNRFRSAFLERRRDALAIITARARERGDLPGRPDSGTAADIVFGTIWYRILATHQPFDADLVNDLVGLLARPVRARGASAGAGVDVETDERQVGPAVGDLGVEG
jgi:AcrR family transcriptional regulator